MAYRQSAAPEEDEGPIPVERDARFWLSKETRGDGKDRFQLIDAFCDSVKAWHDSREYRTIEYLRAYGVSYDDYGQTNHTPLDPELKFNISEPAVDTAVNKVCKSRIVPMAMTTGGSYQERRRAKNFNRFITGLFMDAGVFRLDYQLTTDSFIGDCGVCRVVEHDEKVYVERCDPLMLRWDPEEAKLTGEVTVIVEDRPMDRYRLVEKLRAWDKLGKLCAPLKELERKVMSAKYDSSDGRHFKRPNQHDVVLVREAWHTKSSMRAKDGRHVITLKGIADLLVEDFDEMEIPHLFLTRKVPLYGLTSPGLMSLIYPGQKEHDEVTERIRLGQKMAPPRIIKRRGDAVNLNAIDDVPGTVIEAEDPLTDLVHFNGQPVHPDVYAYRREILQDVQLSASIPEMSMSGKPPEGVTAAKALAALDDIVAEKLGQPLRCREDLFVKLGERLLTRVGEIAKRHRGKYVVRAENGKYLEELNWKDVSLPFGSYRLKCFPTNFLSQTPSVRYERLAEMHAQGEISELEFRALSEIPDLEADNDLETAPQDIVDMCIDAILTKGKSFVAEAFDDHALIMQRGMKAYNLARVQAPDPEEDPDKYQEHSVRLKALANYINSALNWLKPPAPAPNQAAGGVAPPPQPMDMGPMGMMPPPGAPLPPVPPGQGPNPFGPAEMVSNGMV